MNYHNGEEIKLGDTVSIPWPDGSRKMIVVMLGDTMEHLQLDPDFLDWVIKDNVLEGKDIVLDFIGKNPLEHNDPKFAPVGDYMFSPVDTSLKLIERAKVAKDT